MVLTAVVWFALGGCSTSEQLAEPGTNSLVVVHVWEHPGEDPARIEAKHIRQKTDDFTELELESVLIRLPKADSVVYLAAPNALYAEKSADSITLYGKPGDDGPVRFNGIWRGRLFVGRAAHAVFGQKTHALRFDDVEVVDNGVREWTQTMTWNELTSSMDYGKSLRLADTPSVGAAMAALPVHLELSEK